MKIKNPQWLEIKANRQTIYGLDQSWFSSYIKRAWGCGPTAVSTLLLYLNKRDHGPLPYSNHDLHAAALTIEDVWKFVTPGFFGLHNIHKFVERNKKLLNHYGASWDCHWLKVKRNDSIAKITSFINSGLASDCPIAFLNLHAGSTSAFEGWHWIVLIALDIRNSRYIATGFDGGKKIWFDLNQWVESTKLGGGFVYLT